MRKLINLLLNFCTDYQEDKGRLQAEVEEKNAEIGRQWKELEKLRVRNISKRILQMHELWTDLLTTIGGQWKTTNGRKG